jgi:cytochrome d ubiquinol oxidase subunit II
VLVSSGKTGSSLTVFSSSSSHHTLALMAIVALIFTPIVLVYQTWTYWVFRARLRGDSLPGDQLLGGPGGRPAS